ncbi:MAG: DNA-3-methyladenine glycosylase I [Clostridia bacterium]|nr:DNA-3-methyladenine glycosylase I [Clostridia bacterium]
MEQIRCRWCKKTNPRYVHYHDTEWGILNTDDAYLYEMLLLECFQAGLSWECVLNKRDAFHKAFDGFSPTAIAAYTETDVIRLCENPDIIRNRQKIRAAIRNAKVFLEIQKEYRSFSAYLLSFMPTYPLYECDKTRSPLSDALSQDLYRRGMRFVGSITVYSYLQAVGLINSHEKDCFLSPDHPNGKESIV